jgi:hypothetical protein
VLTGDLGFRRGCGSGVGVLTAVVAPSDEEGADEVQNVMAEGVARSSGPRWPEAHAIARRRPCCGRWLRLAVALLDNRCNQAPNHISRMCREKRKLVEPEGWREEAGAH